MSVCVAQGVPWLACSLSPAREMLSHILETSCTPMAKWNSKSTSLSWTDPETENEAKSQPKTTKKSKHK